MGSNIGPAAAGSAGPVPTPLLVLLLPYLAINKDAYNINIIPYRQPTAGIQSWLLHELV
jgi:hypothetical protein